MDFKYINDRNKSPNDKSCIKFTSTVNCDSPFSVMPNFSTPPSRFTKIVNPFEPHLINKLHLPTFSPSVFAKVSTPKTEEKFKWTIEDISNLKPADIDEATISQHVFEEDPHVESIVQQKIDTFFSEKIIVPSPATEVVRVPLITDTPNSISPKAILYSEGAAQTILTLPPILPDHLENILKPYFTFIQDQQDNRYNDEKDSSLYQKLFEFDDSNQSSPALSTGLSPIQFSPLAGIDRSLETHNDLSVLRDCNLSPIQKKSPKASRSACRLDFSTKMSIDASMLVPDVADQMPDQSVYIDHSPQPVELLSDSTVNWEMEYKHVSLASPNTSYDCDKMEVCNLDTPHSRIFTSQRKRLSDSFKDEDCNEENEAQCEQNIRQNRKLFKNDMTDTGYHTKYGTDYEDSLFNMHVFASTPSKK